MVPLQKYTDRQVLRRFNLNGLSVHVLQTWCQESMKAKYMSLHTKAFVFPATDLAANFPDTPFNLIFQSVETFFSC